MKVLDGFNFPAGPSAREFLKFVNSGEEDYDSLHTPVLT
jgi:hypothetical protein